jgi:hypothetical protein
MDATPSAAAAMSASVRSHDSLLARVLELD